MTKNYVLIMKKLSVQLFALALMFLSSGIVRAQLSGTVTLDQAGATRVGLRLPPILPVKE